MKAVYLVLALIVSSTNLVHAGQLDFFDPNVNREEVNEQISDKFWNNQLKVPIFLVLIGLSAEVLFFVWKRK